MTRGFLKGGAHFGRIPGQNPGATDKIGVVLVDDQVVGLDHLGVLKRFDGGVAIGRPERHSLAELLGLDPATTDHPPRMP